MKSILIALGMAGSLAFPALAQPAPIETTPTAGVSCADFMELTIDEQKTAMADMEPPPGDQAADEHTPTDESAAAAVAACTEDPDMMLDDAMKQAAAK